MQNPEKVTPPNDEDDNPSSSLVSYELLVAVDWLRKKMEAEGRLERKDIGDVTCFFSDDRDRKFIEKQIEKFQSEYKMRSKSE